MNTESEKFKNKLDKRHFFYPKNWLDEKKKVGSE
jgi:hypothetical protein